MRMYKYDSNNNTNKNNYITYLILILSIILFKV